jgi:hypothetical protein
MADPQAEQRRTGIFHTRTLPSADEAEALHREALALREVRDWADRGGRVLDLARLERAGHYLVYLDDHSLWRHEPGEPAVGGRPKDRAVGVTADHGLRWYRPVRDADGHRLTADDIVQRDQLAEKKRQEAAVLREREKAERRKSPPEHVLRLTDLDPRLERGLTLRQIVERLEDQGGVVVVDHGAVFVQVPRPGKSVNRLAEVIHAAAPAIIKAVGGRDGAVDPAKLPDLALSAGGDLIPSR